jgi:hypothetical protein
MSGPEVQAAAIATALAGFPLRSPPIFVTLMLIALLALIVPLAAVRVGTLGIPLVGVAALALWSLAAQLAFNAGVVLDYVYPVLALGVGGGGALVVSIWADRREQMRLRELFAEDAGAMVEEVLRPSGSRGRLEPTAIIAEWALYIAPGNWHWSGQSRSSSLCQSAITTRFCGSASSRSRGWPPPSSTPT